VRQAVQAAARSAAAGPGRAAPWRQELARQRSPAALARALRAAYRLGSAVDCIPEPAPADSRNGMARAFA
jgi:hypothetical protein